MTPIPPRPAAEGDFPRSAEVNVGDHWSPCEIVGKTPKGNYRIRRQEITGMLEYAVAARRVRFPPPPSPAAVPVSIVEPLSHLPSSAPAGLRGNETVSGSGNGQSPAAPAVAGSVAELTEPLIEALEGMLRHFKRPGREHYDQGIGLDRSWIPVIEAWDRARAILDEVNMRKVGL